MNTQLTHKRQISLQTLLQSINYKRFQPFLLNRALLTAYVGILAISCVAAWFCGHPVYSYHLGIIFVALILGAFMSHYNEKWAGTMAERLMNLISGFGIKGQDAEFDQEGVPVVSLRGLGNKYYNPVAVAMAGFRYYESWRKNQCNRSLDRMRNCADSLIEQLQVKYKNGRDFGVWEYHYPWSYNLRPPWVSGLAQGVGVQFLSQVFCTTGDKKYKKVAKKALLAFHVEAVNGGVTYKDTDEEWWYEEYVGEGAQESRVLNGMVYALIGIHEYGLNTGDPDAKQLMDKGVKSLLSHLSCFDTGWWTYYDAIGTVATNSYHHVHIDLIHQMYKITGIAEFAEAYKRWKKYNCHFFIREFIRQQPSWHDLMILIVNSGIAFTLLEAAYLIII